MLFRSTRTLNRALTLTRTLTLTLTHTLRPTLTPHLAFFLPLKNPNEAFENSIVSLLGLLAKIKCENSIVPLGSQRSFCLHSAAQTANLEQPSVLNLTAERVKGKLARREKKGVFSANVLTR